MPQLLLKRFGDERGRLVVHPLTGDGHYPSTVRDVGHQNDGHTLYLRDGTVDRTSLERAMSQIEGEAAVAVNELLNGAELDRDRQWALAWFFALQWYRSRYLLDSVAAGVGRGPLNREEMQTSILQAVMFPFLSAWHERNDPNVRYKDRWDPIVAATMGSFTWSLCRFRANSLVLGDQTLCLWGVRPGGEATVNAAWARHGIGVGWGDVARVTVPIAPQLGLILSRPGASTRLGAPAVNRATVYNSRRFVAHAPNWAEGSGRLRRSLDEALETQRMLAPVFYKNQF